jgi:hypothetical protein
LSGAAAGGFVITTAGMVCLRKSKRTCRSLPHLMLHRNNEAVSSFECRLPAFFR